MAAKAKRYVVSRSVEEGKEPYVYEVEQVEGGYVLTAVRVPVGSEAALGEKERMTKILLDRKYEPFNPRNHGPLERAAEDEKPVRSRPVRAAEDEKDDEDDEDDEDAAEGTDSDSDKSE